MNNLPEICLGAAALADIYSSHLAFKNGSIELNPVVSKLFGKRPSFGAMLAVKLAAGALIVYVGTDSIIFGAAAVWAAVAALNLRRL